MATTQKKNTEEINYNTASTMNRKEDTEGINHYTTAAVSQKAYTGGITHYTIMATTQKKNTEDVPSKRHLTYIALGMGGVLAVAFIACLLHRIRICLRVEHPSDSDPVDTVFLSLHRSTDNSNVYSEWR